MLEVLGAVVDHRVGPDSRTKPVFEQSAVVATAPKLPDHPAYQQIMAVFAAADAPLRARQVYKATDMEIAPNNINNTRLKLKRLTERGILVETEQGLFTQPRS
ncbi:hypothetical protein [Streptomyces yerevanensis]|uniref:hypothetical protein n=1 Tax=Streptomyces yerevanensis TaxID=66378 RepID=UPI001FE00BD1|nr:hypothetical protein [Streptomyces yerevanensis]